MKLTLNYTLDCSPAAFWALYFDADFVIKLHLEGLGSTSAEVIIITSQIARERNLVSQLRLRMYSEPRRLESELSEPSR